MVDSTIIWSVLNCPIWTVLNMAIWVEVIAAIAAAETAWTNPEFDSTATSAVVSDSMSSEVNEPKLVVVNGIVFAPPAIQQFWACQGS